MYRSYAALAVIWVQDSRDPWPGRGEPSQRVVAGRRRLQERNNIFD